jgi:predicted phage terminase large subunit-like protein
VTTLAPFLTGMGRALGVVQDRPADRYPTPGVLYRLLNRNAVDTPALALIDEHLVALEAGDIDRLAISMPPQEGKSSRISETFPLWCLMRDPERRIVGSSYADELAHRWGRIVRRHIETFDGTDGVEDLGLRIRPDSRAADRWELAGPSGRPAGGMVTAGVRGGVTGRPADLFIIDDPYKDRKEATSRPIRDAVWDFYTSVVIPRLAPGAPVVVVHTRWHEDDLIGRLKREQAPSWVFLNIPALAEAGADPLGRPEGRWMTSARRRTVRQWEKTRLDIGERDFAALYQGRPNPAAGTLFARSSFRYWTATSDPWRVAVPGRVVDIRHGFRFATVDFASSTRTSADWTVCAVWCQGLTGELILLDLWRGQEKPELHWDYIRPLVERWGAKLYVEPSQWGTDMVYQAGREGWALDKVHPDADKYTRAIPAAKRLRQGRVYFPAAAHWVPELVEELAEFPNGRHDDQVDVVAYASRVVSETWLADPGQTEQDTRPPAPEDLPDPYRTGDLDPETVVF